MTQECYHHTTNYHFLDFWRSHIYSKEHSQFPQSFTKTYLESWIFLNISYIYANACNDWEEQKQSFKIYMDFYVGRKIYKLMWDVSCPLEVHSCWLEGIRHLYETHLYTLYTVMNAKER